MLAISPALVLRHSSRSDMARIRAVSLGRYSRRGTTDVSLIARLAFPAALVDQRRHIPELRIKRLPDQQCRTGQRESPYTNITRGQRIEHTAMLDGDGPHNRPASIVQHLPDSAPVDSNRGAGILIAGNDVDNDLVVMRCFLPQRSRSAVSH